MKIINEYKNGEIVFDNLKNKSTLKSFIINEANIILDFQDLIDTQFTGGNIANKFEVLKTFLKLGIYSKAPCGGFVNFYRVKNKNNSYIFYSGVNEVSNSHYFITVHKIIDELHS